MPRRHPDVRDVTGRVELTSDEDNDHAVRAILRWAIRVHVAPLCDALGLDWKGMLTRHTQRSKTGK